MNIPAYLLRDATPEAVAPVMRRRLARIESLRIKYGPELSDEGRRLMDNAIIASYSDLRWAEKG